MLTTDLLLAAAAEPVAGSQAWTLGFHDAYLAGWLIFLGYFVAAAACFFAMRVSIIGARMAAEYKGNDRRKACRRKAYRASIAFWGMLGCLLLFLGVNKQIDLQTWLTEFGREVARKQGWYEHRRDVQHWFVAAVAASGTLALTYALARTRQLMPRHVLAFIGVMVLGCFIALRTSSFHDVSAWLRRDLFGVQMNWMLEFAGIALIGLCAVMNSWWYRLKMRLGPKPKDGRHPATA